MRKLENSFYLFSVEIKVFECIFNYSKSFIPTMDQFVGPSIYTYRKISELSSDFNISGCDSFSWKKIWDLSLLPDSLGFENTVFSGCSNGSVIAVHSPTYARNCLSNSITVHDMKYNVLYHYIVDVECDKIFFYVTSSDHIVVLTNRGILLTFFSGYKKSQVNLFHSNDIDPMIETDEIIAADFWDNGVVFMTEKKVYYCPLYTPHPILFATLKDKNHYIREFKVIPSEFTEDSQPIIYFTNYSSILTVVTSENTFNADFENEIISFSFSQDYKMISFMCEQNILIITNISLDKTLLQIAIRDLTDFIQICWIGNVAPAIAFKDEIAIIGRLEKEDAKNENLPKYGDLITIDQLKYSFSGRTHLFESQDSIYVLSDFSLFKLSYISDELRTSSTTIPINPSSRLIDSFCKRSTSTILKLKEKDENLSEAVKTCIQISKELDFPEEQKTALMAAAYGRSYISSTSSFYNELVADTSEFESITRLLRVCNSFQKETNTIVNYKELSNVSLTAILMRFCNRHLFSLAVEVADFFIIDKTDIMTEWCLSMASSIKDDEIALKIIEKKKNSSFNSNLISTALHQCGRQNLAKMVAEKVEEYPERVIPFYVKFGFWEKAFEAASISYNTPLLIEVLNKAMSNLNTRVNKCNYEIVTNAISQHLNVAKTVSKLADSNKRNTKFAILLQNAQRSSCTIEVEVIRLLRDFIMNVDMKTLSSTGLFESFLIMKRTIKDMINKYNVNWVSSIYFTLKHNLDVLRVEDELCNQNGEGRGYLFKSFNSIFDRIVEAGDFTTALKLVKDVNSNEKKYMVRIARLLAVSDNSFYRFKELSDIVYKDCWLHFLLVLYFHKGMEEAVKFAKEIKIPKKSAEFIALLGQSDFPTSVITNSKISLKVFNDKFF